MSRSYKKHPITKDHVSGAKQMANRTVRRSRGTLNGGDYKKLYSSWDISDWRFRKTRSEFLREAERDDSRPVHGARARKRLLFQWKKRYKMK